MALRRREKRTERSKIDATPPWDAKQREKPEATTGPYDVLDAPDDDIPRIDLGGLRIPASPGLDLRLDIDDAQRVMSATLVNAFGQLQLGVYAAPRNEGIWDEVRAEIRTSLIEQGGGGKDREDSPFGTELVGTLKVDGKPTPVRFIGVDGPRWFLRGMFVGDIASQAVRAEPFERILRQIVVVRGSNPLPVREPVVLELPKEAIPTADDGSDEDASTV
jgi:Protein of unknown function (DUF3710)